MTRTFRHYGIIQERPGKAVQFSTPGLSPVKKVEYTWQPGVRRYVNRWVPEYVMRQYDNHTVTVDEYWLHHPEQQDLIDWLDKNSMWVDDAGV